MRQSYQKPVMRKVVLDRCEVFLALGIEVSAPAPLSPPRSFRMPRRRPSRRPAQQMQTMRSASAPRRLRRSRRHSPRR